jgi:hypothetical protein
MRGHTETDFPAVVCPVGFGLGGAVRLAEHLVPRRKLLLKSDPFSALFQVLGPDSSLYSASCGHLWSPPGYKAVDAGRPSLNVRLCALVRAVMKVSGGSHLACS